MRMKFGIALSVVAGVFPVAMGFSYLWRAQGPHFGGANLVGNGLTLICLAAWGIARGQRWAWLLYAFLLAFVGLNDLWILLRADRFPVTALPLICGFAGLVSTGPAAFGRSRASFGP